ncbi:MAG: radical SAM protein, partial [Desulfobacterales bacterium]|nr:radical SAM protein [Desulfobacterales bacterium]
MKTLLISANEVTTPYPVYPLGLDHVAAAIRGEHPVKIVDVNDVGAPGGLEDAIRDFDPEIIGVSLRNVDNTDVSEPRGFIHRHREIVAVVRGCSDAPLVLGGSGFTMFPERIMDALGAEYGVIGEGERLKDLLRCLQKGGDPRGIPGVITPGAPGRIPPPWEGRVQPDSSTDKPHARFYLERGGMLNLQTRRGCPFHCIYCTYPHIEGHTPRLIPPARVAETALNLEAAGAKYLFITDSAFNADVPHSMEVARAFKEAGLSTPWGAFFAPMTPPDGYFSLLREAGLTHVEFGADSLCDEMLKSYGKPFRVKHALRAHRAAVDARLHVAHYFLLGGPGESRETLAQTFLNV